MTSLTETEMGSTHAMEAAFLWSMRDAATRAPVYDLADLAVVDERLEANLEGLRLHGDVGWESAREGVEMGDAGEAFVATLFAMERRDLRGVAGVLDVTERRGALRKGIAAAVAWAPNELAGPVLAGLLHGGCPPEVQRIGIAASAARRRDPGQALGFALHADHPGLRERALRAAGELGRVDLRPEIRAALDSEDRRCRFAAAWAGALLGEPASTPVLWSLAAAESDCSERAAAMAARRAPGEAPARIDGLARSGRGTREAIAAAGALGDPALVPWLLEQMASPALARRAAYAFATITGVDFAALELTAEPPEGFRAGPTDDPGDEDVAIDPDGDLPWPDRLAVDRWWRLHRRELRAGTRHLLGKPIAPEWLEEVLTRAAQPARAAAAVELCLASVRRVLFEVRARAAEQRRALRRSG